MFKVIPEFNGDLNVKFIQPEMFLARLYQIGLKDLTSLQVACLMKVLGKPEIDDYVNYNELELLLNNFGVKT
jgi:hypothetical protein